MKTKGFVLLIVLSLLLVACSKTTVVKLDQPAQPAETKITQETSKTEKTEKTETSVQQPEQSIEPTSGLTPVKCEDNDGEDIYSSGKVIVTYSDKSTKTFIDQCPVQNENFQVEYVCAGNNVKIINSICDELCVAGVCI